ncbi:MAG: hypothetical protein EBX78_08680 [Gammaproteobacteria bacterium]|nr:hypothetical protein [Gammaproteobacteria bacterium]
MAERKSFLMRVDPALWRELERWAADDLRSVNGQLEYLLREALKKRGVTTAPAPEGTESTPKNG